MKYGNNFSDFLQLHVFYESCYELYFIDTLFSVDMSNKIIGKNILCLDSSTDRVWKYCIIDLTVDRREEIKGQSDSVKD